MADLLLQDDELIKEIALPSTASTSVMTGAFQMKGGKDPQGGFYSECELLVKVPTLSATILPAAVTGDTPAAAGKLTVSVEQSDEDTTAGWNAATSLVLGEIEGGDSGGAAAVEYRWRPAIGVKKFIKVKAALNATATDASAVKMTAGLVF